MDEVIKTLISEIAEMQVDAKRDRENTQKALLAFNEELKNIQYREDQIMERLKDILKRLN
ncbi:MAG: hypothetical protein RIF33_21765 [Cyclobacteriaceae bacterium]